jgi:hypothetical protein
VQKKRFVRKSALVDEFDDAPLAAQVPGVRFCGTPGCRRRTRPGGRHCSACHVLSVRRWREGHAREIAARRRDAATRRDDDARARDSARAKLAMALRRGTLKRGCCRICGDAEVIGMIQEPASWRDVIWVCRNHREAELERGRERAEQRDYDAKQNAWYAERERVLAAIELLPPSIRADLHALAARGPAGTRLVPSAPLYVMRLVSAFKARYFVALSRDPS